MGMLIFVAGVEVLVVPLAQNSQSKTRSQVPKRLCPRQAAQSRSRAHRRARADRTQDEPLSQTRAASLVRGLQGFGFPPSHREHLCARADYAADMVALLGQSLAYRSRAIAAWARRRIRPQAFTCVVLPCLFQRLATRSMRPLTHSSSMDPTLRIQYSLQCIHPMLWLCAAIDIPRRVSPHPIDIPVSQASFLFTFSITSPSLPICGRCYRATD